jgi:hypothetical protein
MKLSKEEIAEELTSLQEILRAWRRRRRELERELATRGISADPAVRTEIEDITAQIREHEAERAQLETQAVEDQLSLAEAEYRALLADVLDTSHGRLTVAGRTRLELTRLGLGLELERAQELEQEIRAALVEETFNSIEADTLQHLPLRMNVPSNSPGKLLTPDLHRIGRAVRLDPSTTIQVLLTRLEPDTTFPVEKLGALLIYANNIGQRSPEYILFEQFLADLSVALAARTGGAEQAS